LDLVSAMGLTCHAKTHATFLFELYRLVMAADEPAAVFLPCSLEHLGFEILNGHVIVDLAKQVVACLFVEVKDFFCYKVFGAFLRE
jgi:hypothetical protein